VAPTLAFFVGVCGVVKDSAIGDVVYSTKVYYFEGAKEEDGSVKARPTVEHTVDALVQLAHRVAGKAWQPVRGAEDSVPKASPAVIASGEIVLASKESNAANFQLLKSAYNDTQVVDMEAYGFMKAMRDTDVRLAMVVRGASDSIADKGDADAKGNQPLAMQNAAAFLFALLRDCECLLIPKKKKRRGLVSFLMGDDDN
jgi:nucleoside phosphorylase